MALTVRLSPATEHVLDRLARTRRQTRSDVVREAIESYAGADMPAEGDSVFDGWADVIGIDRLPVATAAATTGERFAALVRTKARARRAR